MATYYIFNEDGLLMGVSSDEDYASRWADAIGGFYCVED